MPDVKVPGTRSPLARALAELAGPGPVTVLKQDRVVVVRSGDVVVKAHAPDADPADLAVRLATAARLGDVMLPPLRTAPERVSGRLVTRWPAGRPVDPADLAAAPWEDAGRLLARLHAVPVDGRLPPAGGPRRLARTMARLERAGGGAAAAVVRAAYAGLPAAARHGTARRALTHGDWHLGQLVWRDGRWYLIDVDDLGAGDPAWDLARPAAYYAAGLLDPEVWRRFLSAYQEGGGTAVSAADPWRELDVPARALTVQLAARGVLRAQEEGRPLDETEEAFVACCARIVRMTGGPAT
jgi:hypothetical protein|nr:MAG: aminoglycoside phosphotransferase [Actinomycetota bacterium]